MEIGQVRDKILSLKLDQVSGATPGPVTSVDPKGYLTSLDSVAIKSEAGIGDIKQARMLFDFLVKSNPKHAPGWISAAYLDGGELLPGNRPKSAANAVRRVRTFG